MTKFDTIIVAGPTASGKTNLAVQLASHHNGAIISADSRQIYRGMDLGTGKDLFEYSVDGKMIPYHLIDIAEPHEIYSLFHYQRDCYKAFKSCCQQGKVPIMCGGTGLYIESILKQYKIANVPEDVIFRQEESKKEKHILIQKLQKLAPDLYKTTDLSSQKRITRALEIAIAQQEKEVEFGTDNAIDIKPLILVTLWEREKLKERISLRLEERLDNGMIKEVEELIAKGVSRERLDLFGMEYKQIARYLCGEASLETMKRDLEQEIFRLAKRQRTWFRGMERRGFFVHWVEEARLDIAEAIIEKES